MFGQNRAKTEIFLRAMLEKGPSGQPPPARVDLSLLAPAARRLLPFPCSRANRDQKHGSYAVSNCHNVFTAGPILMTFDTHMNHG